MKDKLLHPILYTLLISLVVGLLWQLDGVSHTNFLLASGEIAAYRTDTLLIDGLKDDLVTLHTELGVSRVSAEISKRNPGLAAPEVQVIARAVTRYCVIEDLDISLVLSVISEESQFDKRAVSSKGAIGLMQVMPFWSIEMSLANPDLLFDIDTNIRVGTHILHQYLDEFHQDQQLALLAYNRGPGRVRLALMRNESPENGYARSILHRQKSIQSDIVTPHLGTF